MLSVCFRRFFTVGCAFALGHAFILDRDPVLESVALGGCSSLLLRFLRAALSDLPLSLHLRERLLSLRTHICFFLSGDL